MPLCVVNRPSSAPRHSNSPHDPVTSDMWVLGKGKV